MTEKRLIVRCKNSHDFIARDGSSFENVCPYCGSSLYKPKRVSIKETYNLHFIDREQYKKTRW